MLNLFKNEEWKQKTDGDQSLANETAVQVWEKFWLHEKEAKKGCGLVWLRKLDRKGVAIACL